MSVYRTVSEISSIK